MAKKKGKRSRRLPPKKPSKKKKQTKVETLVSYLNYMAKEDPVWIDALKEVLKERRKKAKKDA